MYLTKCLHNIVRVECKLRPKPYPASRTNVLTALHSLARIDWKVGTELRSSLACPINDRENCHNADS